MSAAGVVTLLGVVLTVVVLAGYLIVVAAILHHVSGRLNTILAVVSDVTERSLPVGGVINDISADLASGREKLEDCVERLKARQEDAQAGESGSSGSGVTPEPRSWFKR